MIHSIEIDANSPFKNTLYKAQMNRGIKTMSWAYIETPNSIGCS